jgi:hypothetical protein
VRKRSDDGGSGSPSGPRKPRLGGLAQRVERGLLSRFLDPARDSGVTPF